MQLALIQIELEASDNVRDWRMEQSVLKVAASLLLRNT